MADLVQFYFEVDAKDIEAALSDELISYIWDNHIWGSYRTNRKFIKMTVELYSNLFFKYFFLKCYILEGATYFQTCEVLLSALQLLDVLFVCVKGWEFGKAQGESIISTSSESVICSWHALFFKLVGTNML